MLPTFLGIGVPRGGTTWLHELLDSHPDVYVPARRKEVRYFNVHYERGIDWYQRFFPSHEKAVRYKAIGEISPGYLYGNQVPERIADIATVRRLILMLRNPIDRAYSHFCWRIRLVNYRGSFSQFLTDYSDVVQWGMYSQYLQNYLRVFSRAKLLILIHEQAFRDIPKTRQQIAQFLDIDARRFPEHAGEHRVNATAVPRFQGAYKMASTLGNMIRRFDLDWIPNTGRRLGLQRLFGQRKTPLPKMTDEDRQYLAKQFAPDVAALEQMLQVDLSCWPMK